MSLPLRIEDSRLNVRPSGKKLCKGFAEENTVAICIGPAGTGKTYLAVAAAVSALRRKRSGPHYHEPPRHRGRGGASGLFARRPTEQGRPYLRPLYDALDEILGHEQVQRYMENRVIEIARWPTCAAAP